MRKTLLTTTALLILSAICMGQQWQTVVLDSVAQIELPAKPGGGSAGTYKTAIANFNGVTYTVLSRDAGPGSGVPADPNRSYSTDLEGIRKSSPASIISSHAYSIDNQKGIDITYRHNPKISPAYSRTRIIFLNNSKYNYTATTRNPNLLDSPDVQRFMESFKPRQPAPETNQNSNDRPVTGTGGQWQTVVLDSVSTLDFPAKPSNTGISALKTLVVSDGGVSYVALKMNIGMPATSPANLDSFYTGGLKGLYGSLHATDVVTTPFYIDSLRGMDVTYTGYSKKVYVHSHTRIIFLNGTMYDYAATSQAADLLDSPAVQRFITSFKLTRPVNQYGLTGGGGLMGTGVMFIAHVFKILGWLIAICIIGLAAYFIYRAFNKRKQREGVEG